MASQGPPGQAQMSRDDQPSETHNQDEATNLLQETGTQVKNMAQGAADMGKGLAQGAVNLAQGAATGAANMAAGAAGVVKNTLGMNPSDNPSAATQPGNTARPAGSVNPNPGTTGHPSNPNSMI